MTCLFVLYYEPCYRDFIGVGVVIRIDFFDERSRIPSDEEAEVTVQDIAVKILELSKPLLEFGHESCEQVRTYV